MDLRDLRAFLCKRFSPGLPVGSGLVLVLRPRHPMNENEDKDDDEANGLHDSSV